MAVRETQAVVEYAQSNADAPVRVTQAVVEYIFSDPPPVRVTQAVVEYITPPPLPGDGETPPGTNPAAGTLPSSTPQIFCVASELSDGTVVDTVAEALGGPFNDPASYYGGYKEARVETIDPLTRKSTTPTGGVQASQTRFLLNDADGRYRAMWGVTRLRNRKWDTYLIDHADRVNAVADAAYRIGSGIVRSHGPVEGFQYEVIVEGMLSRHLSQQKREKKIPQNILDPDKFPALAERYQDGWSPPIGYGELSDETSAAPQGVVRGTYVGTANLQDIFGGGAVNVVGDFYVFFGHAVQECLNAYITVPAWTASTACLVGDVIRPSAGGNGWLYRCTVAGTSGSSAPSFPTTVGATVTDGGVTWQNVGADDTSRRYVIPSSAWGQVITEPHKPGWTAATGSGALYVDYNGYRYTVAIVLNSHRFARSLREGSMVLSGNFRGIEDVGDGTGALISSPPRILQHFWSNFVERSYATGAWLGVPAFGDYSLIDTTTIEAVHTYLVSIGCDRMAILFGHNGQQETAFACLQQILTSGDFALAENRHGQIIAHVEDPAATAAVTLTDQHDAIRFRPYHDSQGYANVVRYRYGYRYVPNIAQVLVDGQGQPLPVRNTPEHSEWVSGLVTLPADPQSDADVIANDGEEVYLDVDFWGIRDATVAATIAARLRARALGPEGDGPLRAALTTGLQGLKQVAVGIDIGTMFGITHVEGLGSTGYVDARHRVEAITIEPAALRVTLDGSLLF